MLDGLVCLLEMRTPSEFPTMTKPIGIRLTASEHATITTIARADGRSVAAYVRRLVQEHIGTVPVAPVPVAMTAKGMKVKYEKPVMVETQPAAVVEAVPETATTQPVLGVNDKVQEAATLLRKAMGTGDQDNVAAVLRFLAMKYQYEEPVIEDGEDVTFMTRVRRMADGMAQANVERHAPSGAR